jgi:hypothetical protein
MIKKYLFYLFRWQLSTPILAGVLVILNGMNNITVTIIANFIGGLIFFWVDRVIFKVEFNHPLWEIRENIVCSDCGKECKGYRLVKTKNYDKTNDQNPKFRCSKCSSKKTKKLKKEGILV